MKRVKVTEKTELQIRADASNASNTPGVPLRSIGYGRTAQYQLRQLGRISSMQPNSNRVIVVGLRLNF